MFPGRIIEKKRDGGTLSKEETSFLVDGYTAGDIPDYQMSAFAMAVYFRGMSEAETVALTNAMMLSGTQIETSSIPAPSIDKHSTGGVGDKVSLILAPAAAACGLYVPMIAGRGLGITGGTIDKLESIPGYRTDLTVKEFLKVVKTCGCSITSQTAELAPADRKFYALRDVTGTVPSVPLIAASIMSKKLAGGAQGLVLDVKCGRGAFMRNREGARALANTMTGIGRRMNRSMAALITDMNQPLGRNAGNAVEVAECAEVLRGEGPEDLIEVTAALGARMLLLAGRAASAEEGEEMIKGALASGKAWEKFLEMVELHGGDIQCLRETSRLPRAPVRETVGAKQKGYVSDVNARIIGEICSSLGAGRSKITDSVVPAAGITGLLKVGEAVEKGQPLLELHTGDQDSLEAAKGMIDSAVRISSDKPRETTGPVLEQVNP
ncbi:MAG: thymidine phosphorylase [Kiritimatiellia bacterium]